jgi:predicted transcriptional regulator
MQKDLEYIELFNQLEQHFRKVTKSDNNVSFIEMMNKLKDNYLVRQYYDELKEHAQLRNVISHKRGTEYFATPSDLALVSIKKIKDLVIQPKKLYSLIKTKPVVFETDSKMIDIFNTIRENGFSQFPVYDKGKYVGLLTTNTISLWVSNSITENGEVIEDIKGFTAEDILKFNEKFDEAYFISKNINVNEFLDLMFQKNQIKSWIMTEDGQRNLKPLRLITPYDYEVILESITK